MARTLRRTLLVLAVLPVLLFGALCHVLHEHEQEIADTLVAAFNEGQQGRLGYHHVELSPFRAFPYISIDIKGLRFDGDKVNTSDRPICAFEDAYLGFDILDLLHGEFTIRKLVLNKGHLFLEKYADGTYNISRAMARAGPPDSTGTTHLDLKRIELREVTIHEVNKGDKPNELVLDISKADAYISMIGDEMELGVLSDLHLRQYTSGTTTWFRELPFTLDCRMSVRQGLVTIHPSSFAVETGKLDMKGTLDLERDLLLDLELSGRKKNFDTFIAFAPPAAMEKLKEFKNEGDIFFEGRVSGPLNVRSPLIDLKLGCRNTQFHHRSHDKALRDVAFTGHFRTGDDGSLEKGYLELVNLYGEPEKGLMKGTIRVDNLVDPRITMDFHARFDLAHLKTFYALDAIEDGEGLVTIDVTLNEYVGPDSVLHFATKMTDGVVSNIRFEDVDLKLAGLDLPFKSFNGKLLLDGDDLKSEGLRVRIGQSDLALDFAISNISALLHHASAPVDLALHGESKALHLAELLTLADPASTAAPDDAAWARDTVRNLKFDMDLHTTVDALEKARHLPAATVEFRHLELATAKYPHHLDDVRGTIALSDDRLTARDLTFTLGRNDIHLDLELGGLSALLDSTATGAVTHRAAIRSGYFNAKELLVYDGKPLIHEDIEEEVIRDLVFAGSGWFKPNTGSGKGLSSDTHIDRLTLRLNDLPALKELDGRMLTDTSGCVTLKGLKLAMGQSDLAADLYMRHFLDGDLLNKNIEGTLRASHIDLDELSSWSSDADAPEHEDAFNLFALHFPQMKLHAEIGHLRRHKVLLDHFRADIRTTREHQVHMDTIRFDAAGGSFGGHGILDGSKKDSIVLHGVFQVRDIELDRVLYKLDNFGQDFVVHQNLHGSVTGQLRVDAHLHPDLTADMAHTTVTADLAVRDGRLTNFAPMHAMADYMGDKDLDNIRFGELANRFTFRDGALHIPEMKITSTLGYLYMSGKQDMDLRMDYTLRMPLGLVKRASWNSVRNKLRSNARKDELARIEKADEEIISTQKGPLKGYLAVNITGTPDMFEIHLGKGDRE